MLGQENQNEKHLQHGSQKHLEMTYSLAPIQATISAILHLALSVTNTWEHTVDQKNVRQDLLKMRREWHWRKQSLLVKSKVVESPYERKM